VADATVGISDSGVRFTASTLALPPSPSLAFGVNFDATAGVEDEQSTS
jgi:hypothetical protein